MSRFSEALVPHRRRNLSVEKEWLYADPFLGLPPESRPQFRRKPATAGLNALPLPLSFQFHQRKAGRPLLVWPQPCKKLSKPCKLTSSRQWQRLPAGGARKLTAKTKARSKLLCGGQRMEAAWKGREQNLRGQTAAWKKVSNLSLPKTNNESTEKQNGPFHVLGGENRF